MLVAMWLWLQIDLERDSSEVVRWRHYLEHERKSKTDQALTRAEFYAPQFKRIFKDHGVPPELIWIALVESGFRPSPGNRSGAQGMFQFKKETARAFGLTVDAHKDERNHPFLAADACAKYLVYLYEKFQSWDLVLAAYNLGEGDIRRARGSNKRSWGAIRARLRPETQAYVPKVKAAALIGQAYLNRVENRRRPPMHEYLVKPGDTLYSIAKLFEIDIDELKLVNGLEGEHIDLDQVIVIPVRE